MAAYGGNEATSAGNFSLNMDGFDTYSSQQTPQSSSKFAPSNDEFQFVQTPAGIDCKRI